MRGNRRRLAPSPRQNRGQGGGGQGGGESGNESGGEFGVRGSVTAYNVSDGKQVWRGYSMGPDSDTLIDPQKTTNLGKPVGE